MPGSVLTDPLPKPEDLDKLMLKMERAQRGIPDTLSFDNVLDCGSYSSSCSSSEKRGKTVWLSAEDFVFQCGDKTETLMDRLAPLRTKRHVITTGSVIEVPFDVNKLLKALEGKTQERDVSVDARKKSRTKRKQCEDWEEIDDPDQVRIEKRRAKNRRTAHASRLRKKARQEQIENENENLKKENQMFKSAFDYLLSEGAFGLNPHVEYAALETGILIAILPSVVVECNLKLTLGLTSISKLSLFLVGLSKNLNLSCTDESFVKVVHMAVRWIHGMMLFVFHCAGVPIQCLGPQLLNFVSNSKKDSSSKKLLCNCHFCQMRKPVRDSESAIPRSTIWEMFNCRVVVARDDGHNFYQPRENCTCSARTNETDLLL